MTKRLDEAIKSFGDNGVFVKLSTRRYNCTCTSIPYNYSPKDAADKMGTKVVQLLKEELKQVNDVKDPNNLLVAIRRAFFRAVKGMYSILYITYNL
jgi:hypothetical protein